MNTQMQETMHNGLTYELHGDYYLPHMGLTANELRPLGRYGRMRLAYLQEHRPGLYTRLLLSGKLYDHLSEVDQTAHARLNTMVPQMARDEGVTEAIKTADQLSWVGKMNSIRHRAEEFILEELIYA